MLSISCCRKLLGYDCKLTDDQVTELRDQLAALADMALYGKSKPRSAKQLRSETNATAVLLRAKTPVSISPQDNAEQRSKIIQVNFGAGTDV